MTVVAYIEPQTTADYVITVTLNDVPQDGATVTGSVYNPKGQAVTTDAAFTANGGGTGTYTLTWLPSWTEQGGKPLQGEFMLRVKVVLGGRQRVRQFRVPVRFDDVE